LLGPDFSLEPGVIELYPRLSPPLIAAEMYEVHLKGSIRRSPRVRSLGAVMAKLSIYSCSGEKLAESSRAIVLPYQSPLVQLCREIFWLVLFTFAVKKDQFLLDFTLLEGYIEPTGGFRSCRAEILLSSSELLFFDATVEFQVQLTGILRRVMYLSWPLSFLVGGVIAMVCICPCCLLCAYLSAFSSSPKATRAELIDIPVHHQQNQVQVTQQEEVEIEDKPDESDVVAVESPSLTEPPILSPQFSPNPHVSIESNNLLVTPSDSLDGIDQEIEEFKTPQSLTPPSAVLLTRTRPSFQAILPGSSQQRDNINPARGPQSFMGSVSYWWHMQDKRQRRRSPTQQKESIAKECNLEEKVSDITEKNLSQSIRLRRRQVRSHLE